SHVAKRGKRTKLCGSIQALAHAKAKNACEIVMLSTLSEDCSAAGAGKVSPVSSLCKLCATGAVNHLLKKSSARSRWLAECADTLVVPNEECMPRMRRAWEHSGDRYGTQIELRNGSTARVQQP